MSDLDGMRQLPEAVHSRHGRIEDRARFRGYGETVPLDAVSVDPVLGGVIGGDDPAIVETNDKRGT